MWREGRLEAFIGLLAVASILIIAVESLVSLSPGWLWGLYGADLAICLFFAWEFASRLRRSKDRADFLRRHGFEVLVMVPAVALYAAGTLFAISAALRSLRLIRVVRVLILIARMTRFVRVSGTFARRSGLLYLLVASVSIILFGAVAALLLERGVSQAQITNFSDALCWSISTVTTVGYGDVVPNTVAGRIMGMALMVVGIGVMAAFISGASAALVEARLRGILEPTGLREAVASEVRGRIDRIHELSQEEVELLMKMIEALRSSSRTG